MSSAVCDETKQLLKTSKANSYSRMSPPSQALSKTHGTRSPKSTENSQDCLRSKRTRAVSHKPAPPSLKAILKPKPAPKSTLVIAVRDERLAQLLSTKIHAWFLSPLQNIDCHVIAIENEELETAQVASLCASLGYKPEDLHEPFPTIKFDWSDHDHD